MLFDCPECGGDAEEVDRQIDYFDQRKEYVSVDCTDCDYTSPSKFCHDS